MLPLLRKISTRVALACALAASAEAQSTTIVDWGTSSSYVTANTVLNYSATTGRAFDLTTPLSPTSGYSTPSGLSSTFYGGMSYTSTAGTPAWGLASGARVFNSDTSAAFSGLDTLRLYPTWGNTSGSGDGASKFYFQGVFLKSDFLNGASSQAVSIATATDTVNWSAVIGTGYQSANVRTRLLILDGSQWYASSALFTTYTAGTTSTAAATTSVANLNLSSLTWSTYDPTSPATFGTFSAKTSFSDVQAVGFYVHLPSLASITAGTNGAFVMSDFSITATAIPEPSTYAGLLGAAALLGVIIRRRRAQAAKNSSSA